MKKVKRRLVCFTGIDGGGKTTLSKYLALTLNEAGNSHRYVYARFLPRLAVPFWAVGRFVFLRGKDMQEDYSGYVGQKKSKLESSFLARAHEGLIFLDYLLQLFFKINLPLMLGRNLVCDRFVYDTVLTDLAPDLDFTVEEAQTRLRRYFRFVPKPDLVFLIDVPEEVSLARKDDVADEAYLLERRKLYQVLRGIENLCLLDGTQPLDELKAQVVEEYKLKFEGRE